MTSQTVNLNLIPNGVAPVINVSQYDKGQTWLFNLFAGTQSYNVPSGASVVIQGTKKDNTGFQYACTYVDNVVSATETQQMTIYSGDVAAELVISLNDAQIATLNFIIRVEPAALTDNTVISETDLPLIEEAAELAQQIEGIVQQIATYSENAENSAEDSEAYAVGTRNGVAVESGDVAYENNSKYYAEDSEAYAIGTRNGVPVTSGDVAYENNAKYYVDNCIGYITDTQWASIQAIY